MSEFLYTSGKLAQSFAAASNIQIETGMIEKLLRRVFKKTISQIELVAEHRGASRAYITASVQSGELSWVKHGLRTGDEIIIRKKDVEVSVKIESVGL
jgi:hypothetical protein